MNNEIAKFFGGNNMPATSDLTSAMSDLAAAKNSLVGKALLKLSQEGQWTCGQESTPLEHGTRLIVNPASMASGYIAWFNGEPEHEVMQEITKGPVDASKLPDNIKSGTIPPGKKKPSGRGWETQISVDLISEDEVPLNLQMKTSSMGGVRCLLTLAGDITKGISENPNRVYPIVELGSSTYKHKEFGTVFNPVLTIVDWLGADGGPLPDAVESDTQSGKRSLV